MRARLLAAGVGLATAVAGGGAVWVGVRGPAQRAPGLQVSADGHHLEDGAGRPFLWLADTSYDIACRATRPQAEEYVAHRAEQGFTVLRLDVDRDGACSPTVGGDAVRGPDGRPNPAYFGHLDDVVQAAAAHDVYVEVVLWQADAALAGWLGDRYRRSTNVLWWVMSPADGALAAAAARGATGRSDLRPDIPDPAWARLLTGTHVDPAGGWDLPWAGVRTFTSAGEARGLWDRRPARPVIRGDGQYEGGACAGDPAGAGTDDPDSVARATAYGIRRGAWTTFVRGGFPAYGCPATWPFGADGTDWRRLLDTPAVAALGRFKAFWANRAWWRLRPSTTLVSAVTSADPVAARDAGGLVSADGDAAYAYLPAAASADVDLRAVTAGGAEVDVRWFDPAGGRLLDAGRYPATGVHRFTTPPGWSDAVLEVRPRGSLLTPGTSPTPGPAPAPTGTGGGAVTPAGAGTEPAAGSVAPTSAATRTGGAASPSAAASPTAPRPTTPAPAPTDPPPPGPPGTPTVSRTRPPPSPTPPPA